MKDTKRALRRHHRQRMLIRAFRSLKCRSMNPAGKREFARHWYDHMQRCSCYKCGHSRKWRGLTIQEQRQQQRERDNPND